MRAVWTAWLAEPTFRFTSGSGMPSSRKNPPDIAESAAAPHALRGSSCNCSIAQRPFEAGFRARFLPARSASPVQPFGSRLSPLAQGEPA
jgi:hypothetical protein